MIKIIKSEQIPDILTGDKASDALATVENKIQSGATLESSDFDGGIFNGKGVKKQLLADQNQKCAFCEVTMAGDYGAVEHYRPKTCWKENDNDKLNYPGYYWLAYEWTNFLCSCDKCNSAARKGNLFPLRNPAKRGIANRNISREVPLIINPTVEDPGLFLRFKKYIAVANIIDGIISDKGSSTIKIFDLNGCIPKKYTPARRDLLDARKREWDKAKVLYDSYVSKGMTRDEAIEGVKAIYAQPHEQFAGMFVNQDTWF